MPRCHEQLVYEDVERAFTERSESHLTNAPNQRKRWATVTTAVFGAGSSLPLLGDRGGQAGLVSRKKAHCFLRTLTLSSTEIVFSSLILVILLQYCFLLPSNLALFVICF